MRMKQFRYGNKHSFFLLTKKTIGQTVAEEKRYVHIHPHPHITGVEQFPLY